MKLIFGFLMFVAAVAITGGLYLAIRKPEQKKADLEKTGAAYAAKSPIVFSGSAITWSGSTPVTVARVIPGARKERTSLPEQQSSG